MAGNPSFDLLVAFESEKELKKQWSVIWKTEWPLFELIRANKTNFNTATEDPKGNSILLPIQYLDTGSTIAAATRASFATPQTPYSTRGMTQAQYFYAMYPGYFYLDAAEKQLIGGAKTNRIPILPGKVTQLTEQMKKVVNTDFLGTQNGTGWEGNGQPTGLQYFLSSSNSPGGISQTTYTTWAATTRTTVGTANWGLVDREKHRIKNLGRGPADYVQLSYADANDVYGKFYGQIAPAQVITKQGGDVEYGFEHFVYRGMICFMDGMLGTAVSGSAVIGRSSSWYIQCKSEYPVPMGRDSTQRLPGTPTDEYAYEWWLTQGNDDCAGLSFLTGIT